MRKPPQITSMSCAVLIHTHDAFFIFDKAAGEEMKPIQCMVSKKVTQDIISELIASKIIKKDKEWADFDGLYTYAFIALPQFGYSSQKMEDVIFKLFEKYKL